MTSKTIISVGTNPGTIQTCGQCELDAEFGERHERCPHNWSSHADTPAITEWAIATACDCIGAAGFDGATIVPVVSYWRGERETTVRIELLHNDTPYERNSIACLVQGLHRAFAAGGLAQDVILVEHAGQVRCEFVDQATAIG